jgi:hypothetical protein
VTHHLNSSSSRFFRRVSIEEKSSFFMFLASWKRYSCTQHSVHNRALHARIHACLRVNSLHVCLQNVSYVTTCVCNSTRPPTHTLFIFSLMFCACVFGKVDMRALYWRGDAHVSSQKVSTYMCVCSFSTLEEAGTEKHLCVSSKTNTHETTWSNPVIFLLLMFCHGCRCEEKYLVVLIKAMISSFFLWFLTSCWHRKPFKVQWLRWWHWTRT